MRDESLGPEHPATEGLGAEVFGKGPSRLARSASAPWRSCSHEEEAAAKTQNTLILQRIIALQTIALCWNIRSKQHWQVVFAKTDGKAAPDAPGAAQ